MKKEITKKDMLADLKRSGITQADAKKRGIYFATASKVRELLYPGKGFNKHRPPAGYVIPYPGTDGFYRIRFLEPYTAPGEKKARKYSQPQDTKPHIYRDSSIRWATIIKNPAREIYIVEGEKKTIALCKLGYNAIGIGGVWNWKSGDDVIEDLLRIPMKGRKVTIIFDSDGRYKPNVRKAETALVNYIVAAGGTPYTISLPEINGSDKVGIDDFIVHYKGKAKKEFEKLVRTPRLVPDGYTFDELTKLKLPEPKWVVPGLLPQGLCILAGKPKVGKSWLALDLSVSIATGTQTLGKFETNKSDLLHLSLEDTPQQFKKRLQSVLAGGIKPPKNALFFDTWPNAENHGLIALKRKLDENENISFVVIDTLAKIRQANKKGGNLYQEDYNAIGALKAIADDYGICLLVIHHLRKSKGDDPMDEISGSTGISGAADTLMVIKRKLGTNDGVLYVSGRNVEEQEIAMVFNKRNKKWIALGDPRFQNLSNERKTVVDYLRSEDKPVGIKEISRHTKAKESATRKLLHDMVYDEEIKKTGRGRYAHIEYEGGVE